MCPKGASPTCIGFCNKEKCVTLLLTSLDKSAPIWSETHMKFLIPF